MDVPPTIDEEYSKLAFQDPGFSGVVCSRTRDCSDCEQLSPEPFSLDGRAVAVSGITMVPLKVGNEVATSTAPAVLFFADGSSVKLAAGSRAKLIGSEAQPNFVLLAGSLDYKVVLGSNLSVTSLDLERKVKPMARAGQPAPKTVTTPRPDEATLSVVTR